MISVKTVLVKRGYGIMTCMEMIIYIAIVITLILLSVTLHEAMHAYTSHWLGDDTAFHSGRLTLNPLAHIDPFMSVLLPVFLALVGAPIFGGAKPVPYNPYRLKYGDWGQALVAVAGPLTNLVLAIVAGIWLRFVDFPTVLDTVIRLFVQINLGFFIFNMLPFPPLDGSRLLYAVVPNSGKEILRGLERQGIIVIFAIVLLFNSFLITLITSLLLPLFRIITGTGL